MKIGDVEYGDISDVVFSDSTEPESIAAEIHQTDGKLICEIRRYPDDRETFLFAPSAELDTNQLMDLFKYCQSELTIWSKNLKMNVDDWKCDTIGQAREH